MYRITCDNGHTYVLKEIGAKNLVGLVMTDLAMTEYHMHTTFEHALTGVKPKCYYADYNWFTQEANIICEDAGHLKGGSVPEEGLTDETTIMLVRSLAKVRRQTVAVVRDLIKHPALNKEPRLAVFRLLGPLWKRLLQQTKGTDLKKCSSGDGVVARFASHPVISATMDLVCQNLDKTIETMQLDPRWCHRMGISHSDARSDNAFWNKSGAIFVDWGGANSYGPFGREAIWLLGWDCNVDVRRRVEAQCVREMWNMAAEVDSSITLQDVEEGFRDSVVQTVMVLTFVFGMVNTSDTKVIHMLNLGLPRMLAMMDDYRPDHHLRRRLQKK